MTINRERQFIFIVLLVGMVIRVFYFFEYRNLLEFLHPTVDSLYHHLAAKAIASGALTSPEPFFRAPFYNYFLGLIYFITNNSISAARFVQLMVGSLTLPLTYLIARKVFDRKVSVIAAALVLLCSDLVYFEGELLLESLVVTLVLLVWYSYLRFRETDRLRWLLLSGLASGLAIITRPNAVVIAPVVVYLLWSLRATLTVKMISRLAAYYLLVMFVPISIVLIHNMTRTEPALTIATQGGINFYIGNNVEADGVSAVMPGKLGFNWQYDDIKHAAETSEKRKLSPSQVSEYYYRSAWKDISSQPWRWSKLLARKLYLILSGSDISNNRNLIAFRSQFLALKILPIGMSLLAPFGLIGMVITIKESPLMQGMAAFVILYSLTFVFFFVNSRFRLPILPLLATFSAVTISELYYFITTRNVKKTLSVVLSVAVLAGILNCNLYRLNFDNRQQEFFSRGNLLLQTGDFQGAKDCYFRSLALGTPLKQVNLNIGIANLQQKQYDSARCYFLLEDSLFDGSAEALNDMAYLCRQQKQLSSAISYARRALTIKPYLEEARLNLWHALRDSGFPDSAYTEIAQYQQSNQLSIKQQFIFAIAASDLRRFDEAERLLREILTLSKIKSQPLYAEAGNVASVGVNTNAETFRSNVLYNLGYVLGAMRQIDSAMVYLNASVQANPNLMEGWLNLGTANFAKKDYAAAKSAFQRAEQLNPASDVLMYNLALVSLATGSITEANSYLDQCLAINPEFPPAKALSAKLQKEPQGRKP